MEVIILFFHEKVLAIFGMGSKNHLLYMSKTRAVSLGCEEMRLGKGKFNCMHIRLNCLLNIWNVWCILLRKINQCQWINVSLWTKLHYSERMQTLFVLNPMRMIIFWSRTLSVERVHFSQFFYLKELSQSWFFSLQDWILLKLWWIILVSVPYLPPRVHCVSLYRTLFLLLPATPSFFPFFLPLPVFSPSLQTLPACFPFHLIPLSCTY